MWNTNAHSFLNHVIMVVRPIWQNSLQDDTSPQTTTKANVYRKDATTIKPQSPTRIEARENLLAKR